MIVAPALNRFTWEYTNHDAPANNPGTSVTPGASNAEGTFTQIASAANIANEVWAVVLCISNGATSANAKNHLLDLGVDEAGGSSYTAIISNIVCGASGAMNVGHGRWYVFPIKIKSGSTVAARIQGSNATAGTVRVAATFYGLPSHPELAWRGHFSETIGAITNSNGVSFTPGNSGAEGTWVSLGTTTKLCKYWNLCVQIDNTAITQAVYHIDLAYGDSTNKHMIVENLMMFIPNTSENIGSQGFHQALATAFCPVPVGGELWVRGSSSTTAVTGFNAVAVGIG